MKTIRLSLIACLALIIIGACSDERDQPDRKEEGDKVNQWIEKVMRQNYLWYNDIPDESALNQNLTPDKFFESLLSDEDGVFRNGKHQYFSYIEKKSTSTRASVTRVSYGFEFVVFEFIGSQGSSLHNPAYGLVLYVLPNSPASKAGLKRGDWISAVDDTKLTTANCREKLTSGDAALFTLQNYQANSKTFTFDRTVDMPAARQVENTPFLHNSILEEEGKKIGYLVYNTFRSGPEGNDDLTYDDQLKSLFRDYKSNGVSEFILDLRYNGGGLIECARLLASLLAPEAALNRTFCILEYNGKQQENEKGSLFMSTPIVKAGNLNLSRLYVLTGQMTASASELVINALMPYMKRENIMLIGDRTIGKNVGSNTYGEKDDVDWLLHPITVRIYNAERKAEYADGFTPDYPLDEFALNQPLYPFGDRRELLLNRAISLITNNTDDLKSDKTASGLSSTMKLIYNSLDRYTENGVEIPIN